MNSINFLLSVFAPYFTTFEKDGVEYRFGMDRPYLLAVALVGIAGALIPYFLTEKVRRRAFRHIAPLVTGIVIVLLASFLLTSPSLSEVDANPEETDIVFVLDMSESTAPMRGRMEEYVDLIMKDADEHTKFGAVVFAGDAIVTKTLGNKDGVKISDLFDGIETEKTGTVPAVSEITDVAAALDRAGELFPDRSVAKRVILLSDGKENEGNGWESARKLATSGVRLDAIAFDLTAKNAGVSEAVMYSCTALGNTDVGKSAEIEIKVRSSSTVKGSLVLYDAPADDETRREIARRDRVTFSQGSTTVTVETEPIGSAGVYRVYAELELRDEYDTLPENNALSTTVYITGDRHILMVEGSDGQTTDLRSLLEDKGYDVTAILPEYFPERFDTVVDPQKGLTLLNYDEIILMDVDYDAMADARPKAIDVIKKYTEQLGRGVFLTCGQNTYSYHGGEDPTSPVDQLAEMLPVNMNIDETEKTVEMVLALDVSSSVWKEQYRDHVSGKLPLELEIDGAVKMLATLPDNAYVGVVCFYNTAYIQVEMTRLTDVETGEDMRPTIENQINQIYYDAIEDQYHGTYFYGGLNRAYQMFQQLNRGLNTRGESLGEIVPADETVRQLILLSDGMTQEVSDSYTRVVDLLRNAKVTTYPVCLKSNEGNAQNGVNNMRGIAYKSTDNYENCIVVDGKNITVSQLPDLLEEIAEKAKSDYVNAKPITPKRETYSSEVLKNVKNDPKLGGYYGTSLKKDVESTMVLRTDDHRPIFILSDYGLGRVACFMSDLGYAGDAASSTWCASLYQTTDGRQLLQNMVESVFNEMTLSTGITTDIENVNGKVEVTAETYGEVKNQTVELTVRELSDYLSDLEAGRDRLETFGTGGEGTTACENYDTRRIGKGKYRTEFETDPDQSYVVTFALYYENEDGKRELRDRTVDFIGARYLPEYSVFDETGSTLLRDLTVLSGGSVVGGIASHGDAEAQAEELRGMTVEKPAEYFTDLETPLSLAILVLFLADVFLRTVNFRKKEK